MGHPHVDLLANAKPLADLTSDLKVRHRLTNAIATRRRDGLMAKRNHHRATHDIVILNAGCNRQDQVGKQRVVLEPLMVCHEELDLIRTDSFLIAESAVPAVHIARLL